MTITWLGHACFRLEQGGYSIIIDPYNSVTGYPDIQTEANAVWCSHGHHDHSYTAGVTLLPARAACSSPSRRSSMMRASTRLGQRSSS